MVFHRMHEWDDVELCRVVVCRVTVQPSFFHLAGGSSVTLHL